ncbi:MAG TPA: NFACT family protein [Candidatus Methylomirabilis sp.]|nr:NFACT family protein [Candidatus Methylomirabilis sp.]
MLLAVVGDLRRTLEGASVRAVQPAGHHGLRIDLLTPAGEDALLLSAGEDLPRVARGVPRPVRKGPLTALAAVGRRVLPGTALREVSHRGLDRVINLEFAHPAPAEGGGCRVIVELFGRQPNLILVDPLTGEILEAARHGEAPGGRLIAPGKVYLPPPAPTRPDPRVLGTVEKVGAVLGPLLAASLPPGEAVRQGLAGITGPWIAEVLAWAGDETAPVVARAVLDLLEKIEAGPWDPRLLLDPAGKPAGISPVRLRHLPEDRQQPCPSLGDAAERLASFLGRQQEILGRQTALRQALRRLEVRLRSRRAKLAEESLEFARADTWRRMGEILVAHQGDVPRGAIDVTLPDHAGGPGATLTIPIDPGLTPAVNAERFFRTARRGRRGAVRVTARLAETDVELARVQAWAKRVAEAAGPEELEAVQREMEQFPRLLAPRDRALLGGTAEGKAQEATPRPKAPRPGRDRRAGPEPRRFVSTDGFPILVGRDNEGNDYLTLHVARSEDLWLHVQEYAGSHVVVRVEKRTGGIPRRTLVQAAQLAAYYSQARDHGKVAVNYTLRKYVRKPRKTKPGLVTITQEKSIVVSPDKSLVSKLATPTDEPKG